MVLRQISGWIFLLSSSPVDDKTAGLEGEPCADEDRLEVKVEGTSLTEGSSVASSEPDEHLEQPRR